MRLCRRTGDVRTDERDFWCGGTEDGDRGDQRRTGTDSLQLVDLNHDVTDDYEQQTLTKCRAWEQQRLRRRDDDRQQRRIDAGEAVVDRWSSAVWFVRGDLTGRCTDLSVRASTECHVAGTVWEIRPVLASRLIEAPNVVRYGGCSPGGAALAFNSWEL